MIIAANAICDERLNMLEAFTAAHHSTLLTGELAAPFLPAFSYMPQAEANAEFLAIVKSMMRSQGLGEMFEGLNPNTYLAVRATADPNLPQAYPFTQADCDSLTFDMAGRLLKTLSRIPSRETAANIGVSIIVNLIVSICKQGTVSGQFIDKIKSAIQKDIGRIIPVKSNYISSIWGAYGQYINETNIGPLMDHFLQNIMGESIRLRVTVQQAKYQALTVYQTIGRAFILNPNLSWHIVEKFASGELQRYHSAINVVQRNGYYGYSKSLETVKVGNFRHLGYLAKELLVKYNNETHLNDSLVFQTKPARYAIVDKIIKLYGEALDQEGESAIFGGAQSSNAVYRQPLTGTALEIYTAVSTLAAKFSA